MPIVFPKSRSYTALHRERPSSGQGKPSEDNSPREEEEEDAFFEFSAYMIREGAKWGFSWRGEEYDAGRRIVDGFCEGSAVHGWNWQQMCSGDVAVCIQAGDELVAVNGIPVNHHHATHSLQASEATFQFRRASSTPVPSPATAMDGLLDAGEYLAREMEQARQKKAELQRQTAQRRQNWLKVKSLVRPGSLRRGSREKAGEGSPEVGGVSETVERMQQLTAEGKRESLIKQLKDRGEPGASTLLVGPEGQPIDPAETFFASRGPPPPPPHPTRDAPRMPRMARRVRAVSFRNFRDAEGQRERCPQQQTQDDGALGRVERCFRARTLCVAPWPRLLHPHPHPFHPLPLTGAA